MKLPRNCSFVALWLVAVAFAAVLSSCHRSPAGVLSQEKMASLMADIHTAEAVVDMNYSQFPNDSSRKALKQSVLAAHGVTQADVDSSFAWYGNHIEDYIKVYERAIEMLEQRQREVATTASSRMAIAGDSVDVWTGSRHIKVSSRMPLRLLTFSVEPDSNWRNGDVYLLRYKSIGNQRPVEARLLVDYADGLTSYVKPSDKRGDSHFSLRLPLDSAHRATRVYGYIAPAPSPREEFHLDSISLVRMRRNIAGYEYSDVRHFQPGKLTEIPLVENIMVGETSEATPAQSVPSPTVPSSPGLNQGAAPAAPGVQQLQQARDNAGHSSAQRPRRSRRVAN